VESHRPGKKRKRHQKAGVFPVALNKSRGRSLWGGENERLHASQGSLSCIAGLKFGKGKMGKRRLERKNDA